MQHVENTCSFINIFPEDTSSRESGLLLVFSRCDPLTVGFGFAAAANPSMGSPQEAGDSRKLAVPMAPAWPRCTKTEARAQGPAPNIVYLDLYKI